MNTYKLFSLLTVIFLYISCNQNESEKLSAKELKKIAEKQNIHIWKKGR